MAAVSQIPVLIAGGGPVGLTLAADLAWRGVKSLVVEPQVAVNVHPRAISIGVRSMEHFRRLGLDQAVIDAGVPRSRRLDVIYTTRMLGREIFRFSIPSIDELASDRDALAERIPEIAASPYYKTWTAQAPLEGMLRAHLGNSDKAEILLGWRLAEFTETPGAVEAVLTEDATGATRTVSADYLVGCDGASSAVRAGLGIRFSGRGTLGMACGLYFKAPKLTKRLSPPLGVMYWTVAPGCAGVIYTIDGGDEWVFNRYFGPNEDPAPPDPVALIQAAIGAPLAVEVLSVQNWQPRQLVADSYGTDRVFLAGDACHLFVPTGGFGMNTGIGDAVDLSWKIDATLAGWGGPKLLSTYEIERRPVGLANTLEAADNYDKGAKLFEGLEAVENDGTEGDATRAKLAASLPPKIKHFAPIGVHLDYRYDDSPLIEPDGTPAPPRESASYTPSARPGHRAPHTWLADGRSVLDLFGRGFTLLAFARSNEPDGIVAAALLSDVPLEVVVIEDENVARLYERKFVLVRPDGQVAWRGDALPKKPSALLNCVRGA
jgi:2-polyprenyl-6-methoxyphenol hydroxylase-like FAD-dependent oxidoreductase